jgi:hypothetical protein
MTEDEIEATSDIIGRLFSSQVLPICCYGIQLWLKPVDQGLTARERHGGSKCSNTEVLTLQTAS